MFRDSPVVYYLTYKLCLQPALTQTTPDEQKCLIQHAKGRKALVEIGVWHGVNTLILRNAMAARGVLFAIDPFPPGRFGRSWQRPIAHREAQRTTNGSIVWLEDYSEDAFALFSMSHACPIDFIFIDGDHSFEGVKTDWDLWSGCVTPGGVVALHDSRTWEQRKIDHVGAARFTQEVILRDERFRCIDTCHSITVVERI